jgi:ribosomal protein S18 acetylase RimI-like enzyme
MSEVIYISEPGLEVSEFCRVLAESGPGLTRPLGDAARMAALVSGADLIVTARLTNGRLVGAARCITDFAWSCYVAELAVSASAQGLGVGRGLLAEVRRQLGPRVSVTLSSVPEAVGFYERIGMERLTDAFWFRRSE